jgi:hypothetical protein
MLFIRGVLGLLADEYHVTLDTDPISSLTGHEIDTVADTGFNQMSLLFLLGDLKS